MSINILTIGPGKLTFGESGALSNWSGQVTKIVVKPSTKTDDPVPVLSGESAPGNRSEAFTIAGTMLQDFGKDNSITEFTWANAGKEMPFEFIPDNKAGKAIRGKVIIEYTEIGGEVGAKATAEFEFQCTTKPSIEDMITGPGA